MAKRADTSTAEFHWMEPWWFYRRRLRKDWSTTPFSKAGYWVRTYGVVVVLLGAFFVAGSVISGAPAQGLTNFPRWAYVVTGLIAPAMPALILGFHVLLPRQMHFLDDGLLGLQGQAKVHLKYGDVDSVEIVEHRPGHVELVICYLNRKGKHMTMSIGVSEKVDLGQLALAIERLQRPTDSTEATGISLPVRERSTVTHDPFAF